MKKKIGFLIIFQIASVFVFSQDFEIKWQQCYGGSNEERAMDIIPFEEDFLIIGGTYSDNGDISFSHGNSDAWIIKIDSTGNILWEKTYGGTNGEFWRRIFPAPGNCYYLLGASGSWDGDISFDPYPGSNDLWIAKIDNMGNLIWEKIIGGGMIDMVETGTLTNDGGVVVFGWTGSEDGDIAVNYGMYDMWMVKLNSDGEIVWEKSYGTDDFDYGQAIISTSDGGFLIGGASTIGNGGNLTCEPFNYNAEAILVKLDSVGNIQWQQCYGGSEHDGIWGLLELVDGYVLVGYGSSNDGDLLGSGWHGEGDIWVIRVDFFGNIIWQQCYGGSGVESAKNILQTDDEGFVIWGSTQSQNGNITNNHSISEYDYDIWFFKISNEGELLAQNCFGGEGNDFLEFGVVKKSNNNFVLAGKTNYGPSFDVACTPHGGQNDKDFWVFEINDTATSIETKPDANPEIKVYPNPATDYVIIEVESSQLKVHSSTSSIKLIDVFGQEVTTIPIVSEKTVFDCRPLESGIYFYLVEVDLENYSGKIVVQK